MVNVACPTCGHFFGTRDNQKGLVLACPKCKSSFRALDNDVTEQLQDRTKFAGKIPPNSKWLVGEAAILIGIIALIVVYSPTLPSSGPTKTTSLQPSSEPTFTPPPTPALIPSTATHVGAVNYSMVETLKDSWVKEGWRDKPKSERALGMMVMLGVVRTDIEDPADREATLDYIQETIGTW